MNKRTKDLTAKQEKFCKLVVSGMSKSDAYRAAYNCTTNNAKHVAIYSSHVSRLPHVKARIEELSSKVEKKLLYSMEQSFQKFVELQEQAISKGKLGIAVRAEQLKCKLASIYDNKTENNNDYVQKITMEVIDAKRD